MSGKTIQKAALAVQQAGGELIGYGCIVDRSGGQLDLGKRPLFSAVVAPTVL